MKKYNMFFGTILFYFYFYRYPIFGKYILELKIKSILNQNYFFKLLLKENISREKYK